SRDLQKRRRNPGTHLSDERQHRGTHHFGEPTVDVYAGYPETHFRIRFAQTARGCKSACSALCLALSQTGFTSTWFFFPNDSLITPSLRSSNETMARASEIAVSLTRSPPP